MESGGLGGLIDRSPDTLIGAAATDIAGHRRINVGIAGVGIAMAGHPAFFCAAGGAGICNARECLNGDILQVR